MHQPPNDILGATTGPEALLIEPGARAEATRPALQGAGFRVRACTEAEALARLGAVEPPALLLVDFGDGARERIGRLVAAQRPRAAWTPVLAACRDAGEAAAALAAGADDFLTAAEPEWLRARLLVLRRQKARADHLEAVLDCTFDAIVTIDEAGRVLSFNAAASQMFGYPAQEVVGRNVSMLMPEPERSRHDGHLQRHLATGESRIIGIGRAVTGERRNGDQFPLFLQVSSVGQGAERFFVGVLKDLSTEARAAALQFDALHDPLTGLPNRRHLTELLQRRTQAAQPRPFALVFVDLDRFKRINDTLGHEAGDAVLRAVAGRLTHGVSRNDVVGRLAGDEFLVVLDGVQQPDDARAVVERLKMNLMQPVAHGGHEIAVAATAGLALFPADARDPAALLRLADARMYEAKGRRLRSRAP